MPGAGSNQRHFSAGPETRRAVIGKWRHFRGLLRERAPGPPARQGHPDRLFGRAPGRAVAHGHRPGSTGHRAAGFRAADLAAARADFPADKLALNPLLTITARDRQFMDRREIMDLHLS